jgi:hypothetical protein
LKPSGGRVHTVSRAAPLHACGTEDTRPAHEQVVPAANARRVTLEAPRFRYNSRSP